MPANKFSGALGNAKAQDKIVYSAREVSARLAHYDDSTNRDVEITASLRERDDGQVYGFVSFALKGSETVTAYIDREGYLAIEAPVTKAKARLLNSKE